jgi:hypothetical protein
LDKQAVGWYTGSYGYHSDDGEKFGGDGEGSSYGETFGPGDIVGCGADFQNNTLFFTKNGVSQGKTYFLKE